MGVFYGDLRFVYIEVLKESRVGAGRPQEESKYKYLIIYRLFRLWGSVFYGDYRKVI
jgi:hypothetical protein